MHRLPLQLKTPSILWDRSLPEYVLFDLTLNRENVVETDNFLNIIDQETDNYYRNNCDIAVDQLVLLEAMLYSDQDHKVRQGIHLANAIVLRSPSDSLALPVALKIRGIYFFRKSYFDGAANDFEMFLHVNRHPSKYEEYCEVYGSLVICFYLMRQYEKSARYLLEYNKYKAKLSQECFRKYQLEKIDSHIMQFEKELGNHKDISPKFTDVTYSSMPFKGFNKSEHIPLTSMACYYVDKSENPQRPPGVYTNCEIPQAAVVLLEQPILHSINTPFIQCELCFRERTQVYTCLTCRYKTYCSLQCMEKDETFHRDECVGYKYLTLFVLDAGILFRLFLRVSTLLQEHIFSQKIFRKLPTAAAVLQKLESVISEKNIRGGQYLKLLNRKPDYYKLSKMQYATLVATAFRLTMFIEKKTFCIETFFSKLCISNKQKMIVVGAILMRLNCHLLTNTFDFEYNFPPCEDIPKPKPQETKTVAQVVALMSTILKPLRRNEGVVTDIERYYGIDVQKDIVEYARHLLSVKPTVNITPATLPSLDHTQPCDRIHRPLSTYKDIMAELYFHPDYVDFYLYGEAAGKPTTETSASMMCGRIAEMDEIDRYKFVMLFARLFHFHYANYFVKMKFRHKKIQQILSLLCTTLSKFRHSCNPNVEVVVLDNGVVVGKTLRRINKDEELVVSYKAHYMRHARVERNTFLKRLNIVCKCEFCAKPEMLEPSNQRLGIYCDCCENENALTPAHGKCPECRTTYNNLLTKYRTEMKMFENEISNNLIRDATDRKLYVLHLILYRHALRHFSPYNEYRINVELKHAKFLALRNYAQQSHKIIMTVFDNLLQHYHESVMWFTFYAEILLIIKTIFYYNVDQKMNAISGSSLQALCMLALHINNGQKEHFQMYETFDFDYAQILEDRRVLLEWKKIIAYNELMPLANSLTKSHKKTKVKSKRRAGELLPDLSKNKSLN